MLSCDQIAELAGAICATAETLGQTISANAAQLMAEDLAEYDQETITGALRACRRELTGRLTLAAILQRVQAADGRPGKDEAWSIALDASDEFNTVVLTDEIRQAMSASAPILEAGDKVGARMAFMSAYERLVTAARAEAVPVRWDVSLGFDQGHRVLAIESAVRMQLLPQERATKYLADQRLEPITQDGAAIAGLLAGEKRPASPHLREKLAEVRKSLEEGKAANERVRRKQAQADRVNTYLRKRQMRTAMADLMAKGASA